MWNLSIFSTRQGVRQGASIRPNVDHPVSLVVVVCGYISHFKLDFDAAQKENIMHPLKGSSKLNNLLRILMKEESIFRQDLGKMLTICKVNMGRIKHKFINSNI